jgi:succinate dehydrogenase / fumarate reductase membrane anchor subunit
MNGHHTVSRDTGRIADHQATRVWLSERLTGLALIPLCFWLASQLGTLHRLDQIEFTQFMGQPAHAVPMLAFLALSAYHAWLGLECILDDYVHHPLIKRASQLTIALALLGVVAVSAFALYTMVQAAP